MGNPEEIDSLADRKISDAELILKYNPDSVHNARYLAGYAVELALKAKICRHLGVPDLFSKNISTKNDVANPFRTHNLDKLLVYSGLYSIYKKASLDKEFYKDWVKVVNWDTRFRYKTSTCEYSTAEQFMTSIKRIVEWIREK